MMVVEGRFWEVESMRACRLEPLPEMRTVSLVSDIVVKALRFMGICDSACEGWFVVEPYFMF